MLMQSPRQACSIFRYKTPALLAMEHLYEPVLIPEARGGVTRSLEYNTRLYRHYALPYAFTCP